MSVRLSVWCCAKWFGSTGYGLGVCFWVWVVCPMVVFVRGVMQVWQPQKPNFNLHACSIWSWLRDRNPSGSKRLTKDLFRPGAGNQRNPTPLECTKDQKGLRNANAYLQGIIKLSSGCTGKKGQKSRVDVTRQTRGGVVGGFDGWRLKVGEVGGYVVRGGVSFKGHTSIQWMPNPWKPFFMLLTSVLSLKNIRGLKIEWAIIWLLHANYR